MSITQNASALEISSYQDIMIRVVNKFLKIETNLISTSLWLRSSSLKLSLQTTYSLPIGVNEGIRAIYKLVSRTVFVTCPSKTELAEQGLSIHFILKQAVIWWICDASEQDTTMGFLFFLQLNFKKQWAAFELGPRTHPSSAHRYCIYVH